MASLNVRGQAPTNINAAPWIVTAGTTGASARELSLRVSGPAKYARPVYIQNLDTTNFLYVKINATGATATDCHLAIPPLTVTHNGFYKIKEINVDTLSLFMAAGAYTTAMVHGWTAS